ncbi:glycerophosphodiester phosphodiesterase family protein [Microvirga massiliensis]|uniref:glycerophosphodiester phosphodiesterase family protein n=1 Tax=Microvirga massiliensis TaxID=1033741 RepID=UPI00062B6252|nr:glycerophosphodiester phosphodiesterase family protein [Microvirga massiliensis]
MSAPSWLTAKPIAHRGLHDRALGIVENTLSAARAAKAAGFAIECDVQRSMDGEAVVFHDFTLDRLTGERGAVSERTSASLSATRITDSREDRIPTLRELLQEIGGAVPLIVEIKSEFAADMRLTDAVCRILDEYDGPVAVKSFDPDVVAHLREQAPSILRGIVAECHYSHPTYNRLSADLKYELANLLHFDRTRPQFISWHVKDLPAAAPYLSRLLGGIPVMTWTVRTPEDRLRAAQHADQMVFEGFIP